ncbi:hypothetical protein B0A72_07570 [Flavobacterium pectinovorum]|uniref:Uncharacterized protein n=1 Tax=Flavobacterium pectinovorum TaxID=29533 RepID=A0AB36P2S8_9FLAO|nr:hypothetical protein B0A72_07570 [Flavobacterium pectinovorum]
MVQRASTKNKRIKPRQLARFFYVLEIPNTNEIGVFFRIMPPQKVVIEMLNSWHYFKKNA